MHVFQTVASSSLQQNQSAVYSTGHDKKNPSRFLPLLKFSSVYLTQCLLCARSTEAGCAGLVCCVDEEVPALRKACLLVNRSEDSADVCALREMLR